MHTTLSKIFLFTLAIVLPLTTSAQAFDPTSINPADLIKDLQGASGQGEFNTEEYQQILNTSVKPDIKEQISLNVSPSAPRPNQVITMTIANYSTDLTRSKIDWYVNDKLTLSQIGAITFQFTNASLGKSIKVKFVITKQDGGIISESRTFTPAEVDLIYKAETFTPPLYAGKALYTAQSIADIVAIPQFINSQGAYLSPDTLVYKWYKDGDYVQNSSGYGKQAFRYEGLVISRDTRIGLQVSTLDNKLVAESGIILSANNPEIAIYEKNPTLGTVYEKNISGSFYLGRPEIEFEAVPYFFNNSDTYQRQNKYTWLLNGNQINSPNQNTIVFRNEENQTGQSKISLRIKNSTILQNASKEFQLLFGETLNDFTF